MELSTTFKIPENTVSLVRRDEVPSLRTIEVDGVEHWLGHVKDFTKHRTLVEFLPKDNRVSMAWVRLEAGEQLDPHTHPVDSMILICEGGAQTLGDVQKPMYAGDILLVPQGRPHGFVGAQPNGFWGLSIQFDSRGLYEEIDDPWALFDPARLTVSVRRNPIEQLFAMNEEYMDRFDKHRLFALINRGLLEDAASRARFLDCFQVWSNYFQKMLFTRAFTVRDPQAEELSWEHLVEEFGHNRDLSKDRPELRPVFDPVLEATCAWFPWKTALIGDIEKVVLVHLVVEASATYFYKHVQPKMARAASGAHFDHHKVADNRHVAMGYEFLEQQHPENATSLFEIQRQGWSMLTALMGRIADLVVHHADLDGAADVPSEPSQERKARHAVGA